MQILNLLTHHIEQQQGVWFCFLNNVCLYCVMCDSWQQDCSYKIDAWNVASTLIWFTDWWFATHPFWLHVNLKFMKAHVMILMQNDSLSFKAKLLKLRPRIPSVSEQTQLNSVYETYVKDDSLTSMTSSAGKMPMFDNVLKKASLFWGCNVCENAQNSFRKFTYKNRNKCGSMKHGTVATKQQLDLQFLI